MSCVYYRLASQSTPNFPQRKLRPPVNKPRNIARPKLPVRLNRNNVFHIPSPSLEEHYEEHKSSPIKQNTSQFQNQMPQRQQMIRQESQNQYLIQPRQKDKPQVQRPLPQFLHSSQIQNIIGML